MEEDDDASDDVKRWHAIRLEQTMIVLYTFGRNIQPVWIRYQTLSTFYFIIFCPIMYPVSA